MSAVIKLARLDRRRLAADFSAAMRDAHSVDQLKRINGRNVAETDSDIDHAHDYYDANDMAADAVALQLGADGWSWDDVRDDVRDAMATARRAGYTLSRILLACEWSGTVRDEFAARGHDVMSCDILETATPGRHYVGDVRDVLRDGWHMMLAFPPCTFLTSSQLWRCQPKHDKNYPARQLQSDAALEFVGDLMTAPIDRIAIENPVGRIGTAIRPADQYVQPYEYGDDASKRTGLWLQYLPKLVADPADYVAPRAAIDNNGRPCNRWANQCDGSGADRRGPSANRGQLRGKTYAGIAKAMAAQWGGAAVAFSQ